VFTVGSLEYQHPRGVDGHLRMSVSLKTYFEHRCLLALGVNRDATNLDDIMHILFGNIIVSMLCVNIATISLID
jgi:hypothetical protein